MPSWGKGIPIKEAYIYDVEKRQETHDDKDDDGRREETQPIRFERMAVLFLI